MQTVPADTLILSDLHLGSEVSRARDALGLLKASRFRRLILLGDIFCDLNFRRLKKEHWQFLSYIRKLSNPKRKVEVVWVEGNHDRGLSAVMSHLVGVRVYEQYRWEYQGIRHVAVHGHQFDRFGIDNAVVSGLGAFVYLYLQKLDTNSQRFSGFLDRLNTRWMRLSPKVAAGAIALARHLGATRVFCGHTHTPMQLEAGGVAYYNTGCWTQDKPTYIEIREEGVALHSYACQLGFEDKLEEREDSELQLSGAASSWTG